MDNIIDLTGGDSTFIAEMIHMFIAQAGTFKTEAADAVSNSDIVLLKQKAHKFKTSAQLFQIEDLHALLAQIERIENFSQAGEIKSLLDEIEKMADEAVCQLRLELENI